MKKLGKIIVLSGPTGSGESAITKKILAAFPGMERIITATSRQPRPYEKNGVDYHFVTPNQFKKMIDAHEILEYIKIPNRNVYYGTMKSEIEKKLNTGINLVGNLGWPGHESFEKIFPHRVLSIFIKPDSLAVIQERLIKRDPTISQEEIKKRLENARREMNEAKYYTHTVTNPDRHMQQAVEKIKTLIKQFIAQA